MDRRSEKLHVAFKRHDRSWRSNAYVYPVISRRSGGVSIGINLNPDKACNFDCVYCQVDRTVPPSVRRVDLARLEQELAGMIETTRSGELFAAPPFDVLDPADRVVRDIAFSGDGEPTTFSRFREAVEIAARVRQTYSLDRTKIVVITDATYLMKPRVKQGLAVLDANNGEIWAKLDAGSEAYFESVDRPNVPLRTVLDNILDASRVRPLVIQSLWMRLRGEVPPWPEIDAYCDRLNEILVAGGQLKAVQLYTIARRTAESFVAPLADAELDALVARVRGRVAVPVETYYGVTG